MGCHQRWLGLGWGRGVEAPHRQAGQIPLVSRRITESGLLGCTPRLRRDPLRRQFDQV